MFIIIILGVVIGLLLCGLYTKIKDPEIMLIDLYFHQPMILVEEIGIVRILIGMLGITIIWLSITFKKAGITTKKDIKYFFELVIENIKLSIITYAKEIGVAMLIMIGLWLSMYVFFSFFFLIIPIYKYTLLISIMYIISSVVCVFGILNLGLSFFNYYVEKYSENQPKTPNKFVKLLWLSYQNLAKFLNKKKLLDKIFVNFWFQFCNKNQEESNIAAFLSVFLILTYGIFLKLYFRLFFEINTLSENDLLLIIALFFVASIGLLYRVITNFSFKFVPFIRTFLPDIFLDVKKKNKKAFVQFVGSDHQDEFHTPSPPNGPKRSSTDSIYQQFMKKMPKAGGGLWMKVGVAAAVGTCTIGCYGLKLLEDQNRINRYLAAQQHPNLAPIIFENRSREYAKWSSMQPPKSGLPSVFDSFLQHEFWGYINTIGITIILAAVIILAILYFRRNIINNKIFTISVAEMTDISAIYGMFYTSTIELAGRKGSRIFGLFLTIFIYLAILNLIGLLFVAVTAKSQLSTTFWFSLTIIISFILLGIRNKGLQFFLMFWNTGVGIAMRILLLFVEVLSFAIRPLSYALRLFANLLSGHILLHLFSKVINLLRKKNKFVPAIGPFLFLCAFGILETLIAVLQSFIPATLGQIWANELY